MTLIHFSALILCFVTYIFYSLSPKIKIGFLFCGIIVLPPCINAHKYSAYYYEAEQLHAHYNEF